MDSLRWAEMLNGFADASMYQTWPYGLARSGPAHISHLVVKRGSDVVGAAQARLALIPYLNFGIAYVFWGPLWRRRDGQADAEVFRQALRALRAEYVARRKMVVRIIPNLPDTNNELFQQILEEEGYVIQPWAKRRRTIVVDIRPSVEDLYQGLHQKWRYNLKKARKGNLEIIEGGEDVLFECFERMHAQMRARKQLVGLTDPALCRKVQRKLMSDQKLKVILCKADGEVCSGGICSALGDTGIYLFGATSNHGTKTYASYLVHWKMLEWVKSRGCRSYDLNGINPVSNPGGYQFKSQLGGTFGRDIHQLGAFDAYPSATMRSLVTTAEVFRLNLKKAVAYLSRCGRL
jgi:lipid II:glycine glycyltransferase (peptidoglycan interpeptide bridge formation enzyme)